MDAREQLRRYLEQRREMGETELVLDRMTVDEAMRLLGGGAPGKAATPVSSASKSAAPRPRTRTTGARFFARLMRRSKRRRPVDRWTGWPVDR